MDIALKNAETRRDEVLLKIDEIESKIKALEQQLTIFRGARGDIERFIADWHRFAGTAFSEPEPESTLSKVPQQETISQEVRRGRVTGNPRKEIVASTAREVIRKADRSLSRAELYQALREQGIVIQGADPEKTLSTMLWRMRNEVVRVRGGGYWLAGIPNESVGYDPATSPAGGDILETPMDEIPTPEEELEVDRASHQPSEADLMRQAVEE